MKNLLLVVAHPDDESFTMAGTAAKYKDAGWTVRLLSATELGYRDGELDSRPPGEIEEKIFRYMTSFTPDVTITFEPKGISNNPDHMKLSRAVTYAFQRYAKTITHLSQLPRHPRDMWKIEFAQAIKDSPEPRLYYACMPESVGAYLLKTKVLPRESFGKPWSLIDDKHITTIIDISRFAKIKERKLGEQKSQEWSQPLPKQEFFILRMQGTKEVFMGKTDHVSNRL